MFSSPVRTQRRGRADEGADMAKADDIVAGLGGAGNIVEVEGCITRLRTELTDPSLVDEAALKRAGAHGVVRLGTVVQVVVGPEADMLADDIQDLL
ncbi:MAG TPA: PTS glucose/sucrose transporter subunit IIB [Pseudonocardia sp.]|uniref:PTS glucose/sucrose transporter subunit IIB n=1 Tax=Pseudonocardia sp. TaxID=60912 RepID=UPI002CEFE9FF|nr:PTS glucose/sucrose transporter subunit IIB [Pseudonocardia sp.]HTF49589.1 PTS glucose/sucrose transporter subunit IIB [Pseudonocardia sp.]